MSDTGEDLRERVRAVCREFNITQGEWLDRAGLSTSYLGKYMREGRLPENGAQQLAEAVGISIEWLRKGKGAMRSGAPATEAPAPTPAAPAPALMRAPTEAEIAALEAYKRGAGSAEDVFAVLEAIRDGAALLPRDREAAVTTLDGMLRTAARLRRHGTPVTAAALAVGGHAPRSDPPPDSEGERQLRELGGEPPRAVNRILGPTSIPLFSPRMRSIRRSELPSLTPPPVRAATTPRAERTRRSSSSTWHSIAGHPGMEASVPRAIDRRGDAEELTGVGLFVRWSSSLMAVVSLRA